MELVLPLLQCIGRQRESSPAVLSMRHTRRNITTCVRASAFMNDLGTNYLESVNCTIAAKATKRCDFQTSHWGRAQIAIMNRALPCGALGVANRIRTDLNLNELTDEAARKARALERKNIRATSGQEYVSEEGKKRLTNERYKAKEASSARIAEYKTKHVRPHKFGDARRGGGKGSA